MISISATASPAVFWLIVTVNAAGPPSVNTRTGTRNVSKRASMMRDGPLMIRIR